MKAKRQAAVLRIVQRQRVASQQELARRLRAWGCRATQASLSRDLRELGLVKLDGRYVAPGRLFGAGRREAFSELVTRVIPVGAHLVVVRTAVGAAGAVAAELDRRGLPEIAGTLAGDDTIFIAVGSRSAQGRVLAALRGSRWARRSWSARLPSGSREASA